jgi:hypothetical protein
VPAQSAPSAWPAAPPVGTLGAGLRRPVPLNADDSDRGTLTPASFSSDGAPQVVRAKPFEQPAQPMPVGPGIANSLAPKQIETAPRPNPEPSNVWGDGGSVVSQWIDDGSAAGAVAPGIPGGCACGPVGGPCGEADGCCPGLFGGRFLGGLFSRGLLGGRLQGGGACCDTACPDSACCDGACPDGCWACPGPCCSVGKVWGRAEYLLWWIKPGNVPALVTASSPGTAQANAGVLGQPTTLVANGSHLDYNMFSGGRFTLGFGIPGTDCLGLESTYFFLANRGTTFVAGSNGSTILARPVTNILNGNQEAQLVAFPGVVAGSTAITSASRLWGIEGNLRQRLCCGCNGYLDLLGGFRYLEFDETLQVGENLTVLSPTATGSTRTLGLPAGSNILVIDNFATKNQFYGGQLGIEGEYRFNRWFVGGQFKLALGVMRETVSINGSTVFLVPGVMPIVQQGGLLALPSNIGTYHNDQFAVIPEVSLRLGYQVTNNIRIFVGYNFLYASSVARPGDQINQVINKTQLPTVFGPSPLSGASAPIPLFRHTDFWAQGVTFGLEFKY